MTSIEDILQKNDRARIERNRRTDWGDWEDDDLTAVLGGAGVSPDLPTAPVLAMDPAWTTADNTPDFVADVDDTVAAGDDTRLQIQAALGDWSVLLSNTTHEITAPEDAANEVSQANGSLSNGDYEARMNVTTASGTSAWSNTVSFTVAAVVANAIELESSTDLIELESSTDLIELESA